MGAGEEAQQIRNRGWTQGSVLPPCQIPVLAPMETEAGWLVITQACDLVHTDFEQEPYVELLPLHAVPDTQRGQIGNFLHGKNPRVLCFEIGRRLFQVYGRERERLDRKVLATVLPDPGLRLEGAILRMLTNWLAKRYIRPALPDAFNARLGEKPHGKKIRGLLKQKGHWIESILIQCSPPRDELTDSQNYKAVLWLLMRVDLYDIPSARDEALDLAESFEELLENVKGIDFLDCSLLSEAEVSLDDLRSFVPWDFDDLSHRDDLS
ncbi:MAG: hypothetical protein JJU05_11785 [Verrucomicrobia bacterium]|nr:hypothetical protein [Verrucomicrobiota bacterium]MCH8528062.1 hypothetical protein [Kiritimatiellia bacterium]